jgi:hypothetical protein
MAQDMFATEVYVLDNIFIFSLMHHRLAYSYSLSSSVYAGNPGRGQ